MREKQYVIHFVQNEVGTDYPEYDEDGYYRCMAKTRKGALHQTRKNVEHVVFCEVVKVNI